MYFFEAACVPRRALDLGHGAGAAISTARQILPPLLRGRRGGFALTGVMPLTVSGYVE
jgi:hypothetical protein